MGRADIRGEGHGVATTIIPVNEAQAHFGGLIQEIEDEGLSVLVTRDGRPVAKIVPVPSLHARSSFGALSAYADPRRIPEERGAFESAMEEKHAADR